MRQDVVAIRSINATDIPTPGPGSSSSLSAGVIAGVAVAAVLVVLIAGWLVYAFIKRKWPFRRLRKHPDAEPPKDTDNLSDKAELDAQLNERTEMESPFSGKEMPGCSPKQITPMGDLGELQGSPTPPPAAHEMLDPSVFQELPASPVPNEYFAGAKVSPPPRRQSGLRRQLSQDTDGKDSLPISPLPSPIPSPPPLSPGSASSPPIAAAAPASSSSSTTTAPAAPPGFQFAKPTPSPVTRAPSKPQQRPFQINLPHGSAPGSPVNPAQAPPVPSIAVHAPEGSEPPSEESTLQQTPVRMKWKPLDYSGDDYHSDRE